MTEKILYIALLFVVYGCYECRVIEKEKVVVVTEPDFVKKERAPLIRNFINNTRTKRQNSDAPRVLDSPNGYGLAKIGDDGTINQGTLNGAQNSQININTINIPHGAQKGITVNIVNVNNGGQKDFKTDGKPDTNSSRPQNYLDETVGASVTENQNGVLNLANQGRLSLPSNNTGPENNESGQGDQDRILFDESNNGFAIENGGINNDQDPNDGVVGFQETSNGFGSENSTDIIKTTNANTFGQFSSKFNNVMLPNLPEQHSGVEPHSYHHDAYWGSHQRQHDQYSKYGHHEDHDQYRNHGYRRDPYRYWRDRSHEYLESF